MARSTDDIVMELALDLVKRFNLEADEIAEFADELMANENSHASTPLGVPFDQLVTLLSDPDEPIPEYLTTNEQALQAYTEDEMDLLVLLTETRFWHGKLENHSTYFWHWIIVFSVPRQTHREMMINNDQTNLALLFENGRHDWVQTLSTHNHEEYGIGYNILRKVYFPTGIDDAIQGFLTHYKQMAGAIRRLSRRCVSLQKHQDVLGTKLLSICRERLQAVETLMQANMKQARKWYKETKKQREINTLPGAIFGMEYGKDLYVDLIDHRGVYELLNLNARFDYVHTGKDYNPIRIIPGSSWGDWLRNLRQPSFSRVQHDSPKESGEMPCRDFPGPIEVHIPHSVLPIVNYFKTMYAQIRHEFKEEGFLPSEEKSEKALLKQAKKLSESTGEPYWHVRGYEHELLLADFDFHNNPALRLAPIYEGAGNLRLQYMNGILHELVHGVAPFDYRCTHAIMAISSGTEGLPSLTADDTESE